VRVYINATSTSDQKVATVRISAHRFEAARIRWHSASCTKMSTLWVNARAWNLE